LSGERKLLTNDKQTGRFSASQASPVSFLHA
jgi:hypothetical protein